MERKITYSIYIGAFIVSLIIFVTGIYVGSVLDTNSLNNINDQVSTISQKVASIQLLMLSEGNSSSFCPVYSSELQSVDQDVETVGYQLSFLEDEKGVSDVDLKKQYFILEAESYLLSEKIKILCGDNSVLLINFYSNTNCTTCKEEGTQVLMARDALNSTTDIKLFSFDGDLGSPVAEAFKSEYNVTTYPSIIVNGQNYPGYSDSQQLENIIMNSS